MKGTDRYRVDGVTCLLRGRVLRVVNLSVSGLFVECDDPPPDDASVEIRLRLPGQEAVRIIGPVAWVNRVDKPRHASLPPGFGLRMQHIGFAEKMAVLRYLRQTHPAAQRDR